jgi:hypothetical protein
MAGSGGALAAVGSPRGAFGRGERLAHGRAPLRVAAVPSTIRASWQSAAVPTFIETASNLEGDYAGNERHHNRAPSPLLELLCPLPNPKGPFRLRRDESGSGCRRLAGSPRSGPHSACDVCKETVFLGDEILMKQSNVTGPPLIAWKRPGTRNLRERLHSRLRSVRGPKDLPLNVPPSPMRIPAGIQMVCLSRDLRDATATGEIRTVQQTVDRACDVERPSSNLPKHWGTDRVKELERCGQMIPMGQAIKAIGVVAESLRAPQSPAVTSIWPRSKDEAGGNDRLSVLTTARKQRRLAAILVADVTGYSRHMGTDEAGTLARLQTH